MNKSVQTALAAAGGILALGAYVYVLGGALMWLRLKTAGLPTDAVTTSFLDRQLLATGLKALIFEAVLIPLLAATVWGAWRLARWIDRQIERIRERSTEEHESVADGPVESDSMPEEEREAQLLVVLRSGIGAVFSSIALSDTLGLAEGVLLISSIAVFGLFVVLGALFLFREAPQRIAQIRDRRWAMVTVHAIRVLLTIGIAVVAIFFAAAPFGLLLLVSLILLQFSDWVVRLPQVEDMRHLAIAIVVVAVGLNLVILSYLATPPVTFDRLQVIDKNGTVVEGAYIGRTSDGVYLGTCVPEERTISMGPTIHVVNKDRIDDVYVEGDGYSFDYGDRPSIFNMITDFARGDGEPTNTAPLQFDFRDRKPVCGLPRPYLPPK